MRARWLTRLCIAPIVVAALVGLTPLLGVAHAAVGVPGSSVNEAPDFPTRAWSDPWDMNNADDMLRNFGPMYNVSGAAFGGGVLSFSLTGKGYISPLWTGFPGSLQMGRDGTLASNTIDANTYRYVSIRMYASAPLGGAGIFWSNCDRMTLSCEGGMPVSLSGLGDGHWHTYTFPLANNPGFGLPVAWSGPMHGLRIALNPASGTTPTVQIDWIRLYQPVPNNSLSGVTSGLYYTGNGATCEQLSGSGNTDLSALPPGTYQFWTTSNCSGPSGDVTIVSRPTPVVTAPSLAGAGDYATRYLRNPWDFSGPGDVARTGNVCGSTYSSPSGAFSGYNCSVNGYINDPQVFLHVGSGPYAIPSSVYHRITVIFTYNGPFDLHNACHGGTIGRLMWLDTQHPGLIMQTKDWITYSDRAVFTFDLAAPTSQLNEEGAGNKYPFVVPRGYYVTTLRWDPNEDKCARWFHLHDIKLNADNAPVFGVFNVTWRDARAAPADKVSIFVRNTSVVGSAWTQIASGLANSATGASYAWHTAGFAHGKYRVLVRVFRNGTLYFGDFSATGPVSV